MLMELRGAKTERVTSEKRGAQTAPRETVNPADYTPTDKVAPTPAIASGIPDVGVKSTSLASDDSLEVASSFVSAKKASTSVVETVKRAVSKVQPDPAKRMHPDARKRAVADEDARRMRAVKRHAKTIRETAVIPAIGGLLATKGLVPSENGDGPFEAELKRLVTMKVISGRRVLKNGEERNRELDIASHLAYTLGRGSVSFDDAISEQWLKHPVIADILLTVMGVASIVASVYFQEIATKIVGEFFSRAIKFAPNSEDPIKASAKVSDAQ